MYICMYNTCPIKIRFKKEFQKLKLPDGKGTFRVRIKSSILSTSD